MQLREDLEEAIIVCNKILFKWLEMKPKLINEESVRGLVIYHLKRILTKSMTWRDRKLFVISRVFLFELSQEDGHIMKLWIQTDNYPNPKHASNTAIVASLLGELNYEDLAAKARARFPKIYSSVELDSLTFEDIEKITF